MTTSQIYNVEKEGPERQRMAFCIGAIHRHVTRLHFDEYLDAELLTELDIDVSPMSLDTGRSNAIQDPFFTPLTREVIDKGWANVDPKIDWPRPMELCQNNFTAAGWVNDLAMETTFDFRKYLTAWKSRSLNFKSIEKFLYYVHPDVGKEWVASRVFQSSDYNYPHLGADIVELAEMDNDRLLRSEVVSLTTLMLKKFCTPRGLPHRYIPVCLITYAGYKVRVLQAFCDGHRMHVLKSDIISFEKVGNVEGLKRVVAWICCKAGGNTLWKNPPKNPFRS